MNILHFIIIHCFQSNQHGFTHAKIEEVTNTISCIFKYIGSARFMQAYYQILSIILLKEFIKLNVNLYLLIKKCKTCRIKYKDCECSLEYVSVKDDLVVYKCLFCYKNNQKI